MHCAVAVNGALVPGGSRMNPMRACDAVRRAAAPHRQVQPFLSGCGLGSRRISPSIDQLCVRRRGDSTLRGELPTARWGPRITLCHRSGQPIRLTRRRTPKRSPISRSLARVDAKKRPSNRSPRSLSIRLCQPWVLQFIRSKIPASSAEIEALRWRKAIESHAKPQKAQINKRAKHCGIDFNSARSTA